ncbi:MAG: type II toxin-antitoxin system HigB family toxin [Pseudomonadota bacterium]
MSICYIILSMQLLGKNIIHDFKKKHSSSRKALDRWVKLIEGVDFGSPHEVKQLFGVNVDFVGNQTVFDVGGNKVRAITKIGYGIKIILVTHVLKHSEYDKNKWKE